MSEKKTGKPQEKRSKAKETVHAAITPEQMEAGRVELMHLLEGVPGAEKVAELLDKGKKKGKLSASEMMEALDELNLENDQMDNQLGCLLKNSCKGLQSVNTQSQFL